MSRSMTRASNRAEQSMPKHQQYGWRSQSDQGELRMVEKFLLRVDDSYQRQASENRIAHIARDFSWPAFGVVLVSLRDDGSLFVFDGQHRVLASRRREDIQELPCLVFRFSNLSKEAQAFIDANTVRGPVSALQKFKSRTCAEDSDVLAIRAIVGDFGYEVPESMSNRAGKLIYCVDALEKVYGRGADHMRRVLKVVDSVCVDEPPRGMLVVALSHIDQHLHKHHSSSILRTDVVEKIVKIGSRGLIRAGSGMAELMGKGGEKVYASGIVIAINKQKRSKRIAPIFSA